MKDSAVSSVVGVMLMLTITIILVAVVAVAATSIFSGSDNPISAELNYVSTDSSGNYLFQMNAGEPFSLNSLKVVFYDKDNQTNTMQGTIATTGTVSLGGRFAVDKPDNLLNDMAKPGNLIYTFYDMKTGALVSSGVIPIPAS